MSELHIEETLDETFKPKAERQVLNKPASIADSIGYAAITPNLSNETLLNPVQLQIINLMAVGLTNAKIAEQLSIPQSTITGQRAAAFKKLGVHSRTQAVVEVFNRGILDSHPEYAELSGKIRMTANQKVAMGLIMEGLEEEEIARRMSLSVWGCREHTNGIFAATGAKTNAQASIIILESGGLESVVEISYKRDKSKEPLTRREVQVMHLTTMGLNDDSVAERLGVAKGTVVSHRKNALTTLECDDRFKAVLPLIAGAHLPAYEGELVDPEEIDLSTGEQDMLLMIVEGCSTYEIAEQLNLTWQQTRYRIRKILRRFGTSNRVHVARLALESGVVEPITDNQAPGFGNRNSASTRMGALKESRDNEMNLRHFDSRAIAVARILTRQIPTDSDYRTVAENARFNIPEESAARLLSKRLITRESYERGSLDIDDTAVFLVQRSKIGATMLSGRNRREHLDRLGATVNQEIERIFKARDRARTGWR